MLIAAVDPVAEAKLDGLNRAVISGHYLAREAPAMPEPPASFPVLASSASGLDESAVTQVATLSRTRVPAVHDGALDDSARHRARQVISTTTTTARQAYQQLLAALAIKTARPAGNAPGSPIMYVGKGSSRAGLSASRPTGASGQPLTAARAPARLLPG